MANLKLGSLNVRGMGESKKRKSIFNKLDVAFLQETHVHSDEVVNTWNREWNGISYHSKGTSVKGPKSSFRLELYEMEVVNNILRQVITGTQPY